MPLTAKRIVHCDWSTNAKKRWIAQADLVDGHFKVTAPRLAPQLPNFFGSLRTGLGQTDRLLVGFDFPIGLPAAYSRAANIALFLDALPKFGAGAWSMFYIKCGVAGEISLHRPFYPRSCPHKGGALKVHLSSGLGISAQDLLRECEIRTLARRTACMLFWTLGPNQAGTAAIKGWEELLAPAVRYTEIGIWPFQGNLKALLDRTNTVVAETYPAESYGHLGFPDHWTGKTDQTERRNISPVILNWAKKRSVHFDDQTVQQVRDGFGPSRNGEDPFDALIGLCSMLEIALGHRTEGAPPEEKRLVEGWILGQSQTVQVHHIQKPKRTLHRVGS
jgi:hypothetical protein